MNRVFRSVSLFPVVLQAVRRGEGKKEERVCETWTRNQKEEGDSVMYDELIKQLRYCADATTCRNCLWKTECCPTDMQKKAADAIEELSKRVPPTPHGRLIDADALIADIKRQCREVFRVDAVSPDDFWIIRNEAYNERLWGTWCESFFGYLQTRPTIIGGDDGEE